MQARGSDGKPARSRADGQKFDIRLMNNGYSYRRKVVPLLLAHGGCQTNVARSGTTGCDINFPKVS